MGIQLLDALTAKMRWDQQRQDLLAQNVANSDTPNYRGQELEPFAIGDGSGKLSAEQVAMISADPRFFPITGGADGTPQAGQQLNFEVTPEGNGVSIEDEMMKVSANQMDYQTVTALYTKSLGLLRTALGGA
ncbi:MAG TPA: flagellar basal body protein [Devosia sp.]|jgi:flagellar basal-body rod protein FlgB|nr:flagellar basal body protein [Devosia sp.]